MKLKFFRMDNIIELKPGIPFVLEIHDRTQFTQMASSIITERGEEAEAPYIIWDNKGDEIRPKKAMVLVPDLLHISIDDRILLGSLYKIISTNIENDKAISDELSRSAAALRNRLADVQTTMIGSYSFQLDWSIEQFLKAFSFAADTDKKDSLLDRCVSFLGLCADVVPNLPIFFCNLKSFFNEDELNILYETIFSLGERVFIMESWTDTITHAREAKLVIDQQFLENSI